MSIPIRNVYYLLCYAWDHVREGETVDVGSEEFSEMVDLFAKVLNEGVSRLISRGLDRDYLAVSEDIRGLKGKLDLATTVKRNLLLTGKTHCAFDELSYDVPQNQILKATLRQLGLVTRLDPEQRRRAGRLYRKLDAVSDVPLRPRLFRTVRIHRNNQFYSFLLHLCRIIYDNLLVNQEAGTAEFYDFRKDEQKMGLLFEQFVRRFFERETNYAVSAPKIDWFGADGTETDLAHLPSMWTDVVLRSPERTIILDTKFYKDPLSTWHGRKSIHSGNLYQIFAYAMNWAAGASQSGDPAPEGWLLYAAVDGEFDYRFELMGRRIRVCSVDLSKEWQVIEQRLKRLLTDTAPYLVASA
ncbi:5-methylcytosine restriction system specificity protein McrC [Candidatus Palauibacter irciniicola]|uniref:5-methylcytosine restriction system specificity protein McrC n=1 Tax=Candidatus Palauibacter irciniicola TaxID=3056733 RepID=UPI003B02E507